MTTRGYLKFVAELRGAPHPKQRADEALERVGMQDRARSLIRNLSKGMRQRVGLAQAIVHDPQVLILDEPTIGLDPHQVQDLRALIRELGRTRTVLLSTHILSEAEQVCDRIVIIDRGHIVAEDTPDRLRETLSQGGRLFVRVAGGQPKAVARALQGVAGVESVETPRAGEYIVRARAGQDVRAALAETVVAQGWALLELRPWATTLEEIFLELTARMDQAGTPQRKGRRHA